jgi:hypothetical protein
MDECRWAGIKCNDSSRGTVLTAINRKNKEGEFMNIGQFARLIFYSSQNTLFTIGSLFRRGKKYEELKKMKNTHECERCFIIATGPSLTLDDIHLLRDEYTIAMNNICMLYNKTDWRPNLYGIQDYEVYNRLEKTLLENPKGVFVSQIIAEKKKSAEAFAQFPLNTYYLQYDYRYTDKLPIKFSDNAYKVVYDAYSITFSLMQIAIYMGFKEIYLLGADCNQGVGQKNHFIENGHEEAKEKLITAAYRNIYAHEHIKKFCESKGVKVFNATRGGMLEVYERVNLDDMVDKKGSS